jgi:hypothetical protein
MKLILALKGRIETEEEFCDVRVPLFGSFKQG